MSDEVRVIPHEAIAYIAGKKLKTSYNWAEIYGTEHATAFTVAKIMELDVLDGIHKSVIKAVEDGQSFHTFKKSILTRLGTSGWGSYEQIDEKTGDKITRLSDSRLKKVYFTNKRQSQHAGSWHRFETNKKTHPYLRYRLGSSKEHRLEHKGFENLVLPVDDPFWDAHMPMNGWGCECWVQSLTKAKAEKLGISESPEIEYHEWVNKSTGRKYQVPKGIDPSFEYNVGKHREKTLANTVNEKLSKTATLSPERAKRLTEDFASITKSDDFLSDESFIQLFNKIPNRNRVNKWRKENEQAAQKIKDESGLTEAEMLSICGYTNMHTYVQAYLHHGYDEFVKKNGATYSQLIATQINNMMNGLNKLTNYKGQVIRWEQNTNIDLVSLKENDEYITPAFMSSSYGGVETFAEFRNVKLILNVKSAKIVSDMSVLTHQQEALILPQTKFNVEKIDPQNNGDIWITMSEI